MYACMIYVYRFKETANNNYRTKCIIKEELHKYLIEGMCMYTSCLELKDFGL